MKKNFFPSLCLRCQNSKKNDSVGCHSLAFKEIPICRKKKEPGKGCLENESRKPETEKEQREQKGEPAKTTVLKQKIDKKLKLI